MTGNLLRTGPGAHHTMLSKTGAFEGHTVQRTQGPDFRNWKPRGVRELGQGLT